MARANSNEAKRARLYRERKRCGTVFVSGIEVKRIGVELLIAKGWLDADAEPDAHKVRAALVKLVNGALAEPERAPEPEPSPKPFRRAFQAVKTISFGLF
jgi:hypothetical protein